MWHSKLPTFNVWICLSISVRLLAWMHVNMGNMHISPHLAEPSGSACSLIICHLANKRLNGNLQMGQREDTGNQAPPTPSWVSRIHRLKDSVKHRGQLILKIKISWRTFDSSVCFIKQGLGLCGLWQWCGSRGSSTGGDVGNTTIGRAFRA